MGVLNKSIITKEAFKVVGLEIDWSPDKDKPSENTIAKLWEKFNERYSEISHTVPMRCYGLMRFPPGWKEGEPFKYMACTEVTEVPADLPGGMTAAEIPRFDYAVLTYQGVIDEIRYANEYFFSEWAPKIEGFRFALPHCMEFYGERYTSNDDPKSVFELWFPLTGKN
ncbi:GyrI-like domain-containing protein [Evansella sp. LMS18]|jgi:predicted transcriptional regulator YdeE|uniref:GyrI-like domain-containing protein n=1 Tax=Evansella sp. LMS18 TaxID=2924033 RepID=UPI0020D0E023|nr:GyrI-like domain-containing protein [Evansella sp. LMS18]UTR10308.1 GyrI-like domain-containing protein [Evansella sp. LMS18]